MKPSIQTGSQPKQYLSAVFELLPTRRKAAALERVRAAAEDAFWEFMDGARERVDPIVSLKGKELAAEIRRVCHGGIRIAAARKLPESVAQGLLRDIEAAIKSFIELKAGGHPANWPQRELGREVCYETGLGDLSVATDKASEDAARDQMARIFKPAKVKPVTFARSRDAAIVKNKEGRYAVVLNCLFASDPRSRQATIQAGVDPTTGEVVAAGRSKTRLVIPIACSRWHENKFLSGRATLRSSLVFRRDDRWFISAQFEFACPTRPLSGAVLGIDRGCVYPVAAALVDSAGAVLDMTMPMGKEVGEAIRASDARRRRQQKRRGATTHRHSETVQHSLHQMANEIVARAKKHGAAVVTEDLGGLKRTIVEPRTKGARKGGWRRVLKKAQLGQLEKIIDYKLRLAGLPKPRQVAAGGTSQTCPACGHRAKENRAERDVFKCVKCGHVAHADQNAAIIIARRGVMLKNLKKGDKLDALHENMVSGLRLRDDGGLGRKELYLAVVPARCSGVKPMAYEDTASSSLTVAPVQKFTHFGQKFQQLDLFAERADAFFPSTDGSPSSPGQGFQPTCRMVPTDAG